MSENLIKVEDLNLPTNFQLMLDNYSKKYKIFYCNSPLEDKLYRKHLAIEAIQKYNNLFQTMFFNYEKFQEEKEKKSEDELIKFEAQKKLEKDLKYKRLLNKRKEAELKGQYGTLSSVLYEIRDLKKKYEDLAEKEINFQRISFTEILKSMSEEDYFNSIITLNSIFHSMAATKEFIGELKFLLKKVDRKIDIDFLNSINNLNNELSNQFTIFTNIDNENYKKRFDLFTREIKDNIKDKTKERFNTNETKNQ